MFDCLKAGVVRGVASVKADTIRVRDSHSFRLSGSHNYRWCVELL